MLDLETLNRIPLRDQEPLTHAYYLSLICFNLLDIALRVLCLMSFSAELIWSQISLGVEWVG